MQVAKQPPSPLLHLCRVPLADGCVLRCAGPLTLATVESLRRELRLLLSMERPSLVLDLSGCSTIDLDAILVALLACKQVREREGRFLVVTGGGAVAQFWHLAGIDDVIPTHATVAGALQELHLAEAGGPWGRQDGTGEEAPRKPCCELQPHSLAIWRRILAALTEPDGDLRGTCSEPLLAMLRARGQETATDQARRLIGLMEAMPQPAD